MEPFIYGRSDLVRQCDLTWNPICDSILVMYKKLIDLSFVYRNGQIVLLNEEHEYEG